MAEDADLEALAARLLKRVAQQRQTIVTAESCTGGRLAALLSSVPGAGQCVEGGFVTYSKDAKARMLAVPPALLKRKSAVCREVAAAMADGARHRSAANIAIAITGVAGPDPDEDGNPVGLMCVSLGLRSGETISWERHHAGSDREGNLRGVMADALETLLTAFDRSAAGSLVKARPSLHIVK